MTHVHSEQSANCDLLMTNTPLCLTLFLYGSQPVRIVSVCVCVVCVSESEKVEAEIES